MGKIRAQLWITRASSQTVLKMLMEYQEDINQDEEIANSLNGYNLGDKQRRIFYPFRDLCLLMFLHYSYVCFQVSPFLESITKRCDLP